MATWSSTITQSGLALQAKLQAGCTLAITRAVTGGSAVAADTLPGLTAIPDIRQNLALGAVTVAGCKASIPVSLINRGLSESYPLHLIGVYADDPDVGEILYFVARANSPDTIPDEFSLPDFYADFVFDLLFSDTADITVNVDSLALATKSDIEQLRAESTSALAEKADLIDGKIDPAQMPASSAPIVVTGGTGLAYTATISGVDITVGSMLVIVPHVDSTSRTPTLAVNGSAPAVIARRTSSTTKAGQSGYTANWIAADVPLLVEWDGTYWVTIGLDKPNAADLSGTVPVSRGGTGQTSWIPGQLLAGDADGGLTQLDMPLINGAILRQDALGTPYWSSPQVVRTAIGAAPQSHTTDRATGSGVHGLRIDRATMKYQTDTGWRRAKSDSCYWAAKLTPAAWQMGDVNEFDLSYWWVADISNANISADDVVIVLPADDTTADALTSVLRLPETYDGGFRLYAERAPAATIDICYMIAHKEVL